MDSVLLHLEDPTNLMMITGVMILGAPVDPARLKATITRRFLAFGHFRQRVTASRWRWGTWYWEDDRRGYPQCKRIAAAQPKERLLNGPRERCSCIWEMRFLLVSCVGEGEN